MSDPNGGGLTPQVADDLAGILGAAWRVTGWTDDAGALLSIEVSGEVAGERVVGRVRLEPQSHSAEWWRDHYDPNGAPYAWGDYDPATSNGAPELAAMIRRARPGPVHPCSSPRSSRSSSS